jgi:membrane protein DedA with SNARE-associated domain
MTSPWLRILLAVVIVASLVVTVLYGLRSYRTFVLLESAQMIDAPETSSVRGWMTLDYLANAYAIDLARLKDVLGVPEGTAGGTTIRTLAQQRGLSVFDMVAEVQKAIASLLERSVRDVPPQEESGWFDSLNQDVMSGVLIYGYPVFMAAVFFGSLGFPVPAGPVTAFAGSLAAGDQINAPLTVAIAVVGSLLGDAVAYAIGRAASPAWLARWGWWIGYTSANRARAKALFEHWGGATVVLAMSAVSQVSSVVGLLAGLSHWPMARFLPAALLGRMLWTIGYFGLGYVAGTNFSAASGFLANLGAVALALAIAGGAALLLRHSLLAARADKP